MEEWNTGFEIVAGVLSLITVVLSLVTVLIRIFSSESYKLLSFKRSDRGLGNSEVELLVAKTDIQFSKNFVVANLKERYFYEQTGIDTNAEALPDYIVLKQKLGKNFSWKKIGKAKDYIRYEDNQLRVKMPKPLRGFVEVFFLLALGLLYLLLALIIYLSSSWGRYSFNSFSQAEWISFGFLVLILFFGGIFIIRLIMPMKIAGLMAKELESRRKEESASSGQVQESSVDEDL